MRRLFHLEWLHPARAAAQDRRGADEATFRARLAAGERCCGNCRRKLAGLDGKLSSEGGEQHVQGLG